MAGPGDGGMKRQVISDNHLSRRQIGAQKPAQNGVRQKYWPGILRSLSQGPDRLSLLDFNILHHVGSGTDDAGIFLKGGNLNCNLL